MHLIVSLYIYYLPSFFFVLVLVHQYKYCVNIFNRSAVVTVSEFFFFCFTGARTLPRWLWPHETYLKQTARTFMQPAQEATPQNFPSKTYTYI